MEGAINEVARQIAFADVLLINKMDLVSEAEAKAVIERVKTLNKIAKVIQCTRSVVDLDSILNIGAYDLERAMAIDPGAFQVSTTTKAKTEEKKDAQWHRNRRSDNCHNAEIKSVYIEEVGSVDQTKFNHWMGDLLWEKGGSGDIYRMKGLVSIQGEPKKMLYQGVASLFDSDSAAAWGESEPRVCQLVFIGKSIDETELRAGLQKCITTDAEYQVQLCA